MPEIPVEKIIRSRRRSIAIEVTPQATLIVRAPHRVPQAYIEQMIREKIGWITGKMEEMKKRPKPVIHSYQESEIFWFLGRPYPLHLTDESGASITRTDRLCVPRALVPDIGHAIQHWYRAEAYKEIHARCLYFAMMTGYSPASIRITDAQRRWGSCTHKGGLNFSWRLVQAPLEIVDYVIVHELVHLRQPDHSKKFWSKVKDLMPDFDRRRRWLRENERLLAL
jgi:predicted metal-dependent hydrolase